MIFNEFKNDKLSLLGMGCMRLPTNENGKIDKEKTREMVALAIENGVNYFDTAYPYHNGESELVIGDPLRKIALRVELVFVAVTFALLIVRPTNILFGRLVGFAGGTIVSNLIISVKRHVQARLLRQLIEGLGLHVAVGATCNFVPLVVGLAVAIRVARHHNDTWLTAAADGRCGVAEGVAQHAEIT